MVERLLSIPLRERCYSSEVELSAAVRMVRGSIPRDTLKLLVGWLALKSEGRWFDPTFSHYQNDGGIAQSGERQTEVVFLFCFCARSW